VDIANGREDGDHNGARIRRSHYQGDGGVNMPERVWREFGEDISCLQLEKTEGEALARARGVGTGGEARGYVQ
jgi:hypothetical protein